MSMNATYSPEDNKLRLYSTSRLSPELYQRVKAAGFKWAPKQELFVAPSWSPAREDLLLELCGEIEDEDYSPEERAADRAERFSVYRDKRRDEAGGFADRFEAGPAVFGHQNRARAERQAERHDRVRGKAVSQWSKAEYWQQRTAGVISHALHKSSPEVRRGRILRLEAEQRKHEKGREEYKTRFEAWQRVLTLEGSSVPVEKVRTQTFIGINGETVTPAGRLAYTLACDGRCWGTYKHPRQDREGSIYDLMTKEDPITPHEAATLWLAGCTVPGDPDTYSARWSEHYKLRLTYENAMLAEEGGKAAEADIEPGGWLGSYQVQRVYKSPATGRVVSVVVLAPSKRSGKQTEQRINIERLGSEVYRAPTDEEREAFKVDAKERKAAKKAAAPKTPPLINPTLEDAKRLQAIWNAADRGDKPSEVLELTQEQYSARSKGTYSHYETVDVSEQLKARHTTAMGNDRAGRVTVFKIRKAPAGGYGASRVVVLTDKPQKPIPWEAVDEARAAQPSVESMLPKLEELAKACALNWLPSSDEHSYQLLSDAEYIGWAYISSMSQFGWTEKGMQVYREHMQQLATA